MRVFAQINAGVPVIWNLTPYSVRKMAPTDTSFPATDPPYETIDLVEFGFETFIPVAQPYDYATQNIAELPPVLVGSDWVQQWLVTAASPAEIDARAAQLLEDNLADIRKQCEDHILATYPDFVQSNVALGLYNDTYSVQMKTDIALAIDESNRCEDILVAGGTPVPNWPTFSTTYPFTHKRTPPYPA